MPINQVVDNRYGSVPGVPSYATIAAASVPAAYSGSSDITVVAGRILDLYNGTDQKVLFSVDGTNTTISLASNVGKIVNLAQAGLLSPLKVFTKYASAACTSGSVDITIWS